jgi:hypothetical protein
MSSGLKWRAIQIALMGFFVALLHGQAQAPSADALRVGFKEPPIAAKLRCYWWWLNGNTTEETIARGLPEMSRKRFVGLRLMDANGSNSLVSGLIGPVPIKTG